MPSVSHCCPLWSQCNLCVMHNHLLLSDALGRCIIQVAQKSLDTINGTYWHSRCNYEQVAWFYIILG